MSKCRSCGLDVAWIRLKSGKMNPVDPGYKTIITDLGEVVKGRESHFATCPDSDEWRKKG